MPTFRLSFNRMPASRMKPEGPHTSLWGLAMRKTYMSASSLGRQT